MQEKLQRLLQNIVSEMDSSVSVSLDIPADLTHGDYTTNVAFLLAKPLKKSPLEISEMLLLRIQEKEIDGLDRVVLAKPAFLNFWLTKDALLGELEESIASEKVIGNSKKLTGQKIMVEYAHPNTHKEMHIGHMRTLITGESICRLFEAAGATVFRANYQGDIGPHIAKALYGVEQLMTERNLSLETLSKLSNKDKTHFLGEGYVRGSQDYAMHKEEIDALNAALYKRSEKVWKLYQETRAWNLDYYEEFYKRFATKFDHLFFESDMDELAVRIMQEHDAIFEHNDGATIFPGEKYGLHTRVFITSAGHPTYEAKDLANAYKQYELFPFDRNIHVVASEQAGYFQVVFKVLDLLDKEKFKGEEHLSMGMVQLADRKMSSRTGDVLTVDWLLDTVKEKVKELFASGRVQAEDVSKVAEEITLGAVKYSVLKVGTGMDAAFDIDRSVALDGNSGPYLQYTFARTQSILSKAGEGDLQVCLPDELSTEEELLFRMLIHFREVVLYAAEQMSPSIVATYLFEIAKQFNYFYQMAPILKAEQDARGFRIFLTGKVGEVLLKGLDLLGIQAPERM